MLAIFIQIDSSAAAYPKQAAWEQYHFDLKWRFQNKTADGVHLSLFEGIKDCEKNLDINIKAAEIDPSMISCFCMETYLDAVESIHLFGDDGIFREAKKFLDMKPQC